MASFSSTVGLVNAEDIILQEEQNHLFSGVGVGGFANPTYDDNGNLTYFESLGRNVTLAWTDEQLTQVSCYIVAENQTITQTITYNDDGQILTVSNPLIT